MIIAPYKVKKNKDDNNKEENNKKWIKETEETKNIKKIWSDGYQKGDITATILNGRKVVGNTIKDTAVNIGKGFMNTVEGTVDTVRYKMYDYFNEEAKNKDTMMLGGTTITVKPKQAAEKIKRNAEFNVTGALLGETNDVFKDNWSKKVDEGSILGDKSDSVAQGIGNVGAFVGLNALTTPILKGVVNPTTVGAIKKTEAASSFLNSFMSSYGTARSEAYANGADDNTARKHAFINGFSEAFSEQLFEGMPGMKTAGWGEKVIGKIGNATSKYFNSTVGKITMDILEASGEGFEEIISNMLNAVGNDIMHYVDNDYTYGMENQTGNILKDMKNAATSQESWDAFISALLTSAITTGGGKVIDSAQNHAIIKAYAQENNISVDQATKLFNDIAERRAKLQETDNYKEYNDAISQSKAALRNEIKSDSNLNLQEMQDAFVARDKVMKAVGTGTVSSQGLNLIESYQAYNGNDSDISQIRTMQKYFDNRNIEARFDATMFNNNDVGAVWTTNGNGNDVVLINPNAARTTVVQDIAVHEMSHDIFRQNTNESRALFDNVLEYATQDKNFTSLKNDIEERYSNIYDKNSQNYESRINEEIVADYLGKNLGTQEYINRLVNEKPGMAERIYTWVKDKIDNIGKTQEYKEQKAYWKEVADRFETAYKEQKNTISNKDTRLSMVGKEGIETAVYSTKKHQELIDSYNKAVELSKNDDYSNEMIRQETGWFKNKNGNWEYEISDKNAGLTTKISNNSEYYLKDIFEHQTLFKMYPELQDLKVITKDIKPRGRLVAEKGIIYLNNNIVDKNNTIKSTLLHEIQHYIQRIEGFPTGTSIIWGNEQYANSLGEIESSDVQRRMDYDIEQRNYIMPESAKENPTHPNKEAILNKKRNTIEKIGEKLYNKIGGEDSENTSKKIIQKTSRDSGSRINDDVENTSFSLSSKNDIAPVTKGTRNEMGELFQQEIAPFRKDLSKVTEQMKNLSKQIESLQNKAQNEARYSVEQSNNTEIRKTEEKPIEKSKGYVEEYKEGRFEKQDYNPMTEEDANLYQESLMNDKGYLESLEKEAENIDNNEKLINRITNDTFETLELIGKKQKNELQEVIKDIVDNNRSVDEINNILTEKFAHQEFKVPFNEALEVKKEIRNVPIKVSDGIKKDIADYGNFQRENFNKINFSRNGIPVDVAYQTLNELMPSYFPSDIINPTDQLLKISEVANMMTETIETVEASPEAIEDAADLIRDAILNDKYNAQVKNESSLVSSIRNNLTEDIAPTTIRTQESIDNYIENRDIAPVRESKPFDARNKKVDSKEKADTMWRKAQEMFVNRNYVIDEMAKATGNDDIKYTGDMLNNVTAEAEYNINSKQTDANGITVGKGVHEIFAPAKNAGLYEAFNDYLIQKSNIERHAVGKGSIVPLVTSQQLVARYEIENPQFVTWAKDVYKYFDNILQDQVDTGLISEDKYKDFRGENGIYRSYVPFYEGDIENSRFFDDEGNVRAVNTLKRSKGGADDTSSLLAVEDAMIRQTYAYKKAIRQNELYKQIVSSLDKYDNMMDMDLRDNPTNLEDSLYVDENGDKILSAYLYGEKVSSKISDELYNELAKTNENNIKQFEDNFSLITNPLQKISNVRRNLLTSWNPAFLARNAIKDIQDAVINSKHTSDMLKNYFGTNKGQQAAIIELRNATTQEAQQFLALYGSDNTYGDYSNINNSKNVLQKGVNKFARLNELIELAPRFAEFKASLQNGESVQQAIYNAREVTTNFGRGGYITKAMNRNGFTFLNASVQGLDKAIRNITGQNGVKGVTSVVVKGVAFSVLPSILNHLLFGLGDDKDEEYDALPDYIKDNYYLIKLENGQFMRIPKGRISAVFGSLARRTIETAEGETDAFEGYAKNSWDQIGVGDLGGNNILAPIMQAKRNEAWYGGDIVPTRLQKKPAAEQTDSKIDALSNLIGKTFNISPYKVHYVIDQYSGGIGDTFLPMITPETTNGAETPIDYLFAPMKDSFIVNSIDDNKYAGEFYNLKDELEIKNQVGYVFGGVELEIKKNSSNATDEDILKYKYMSSISTQMSELYKEKREVQADTTLSNKEKYQKVQAIQNEINALAKEGLDNYQGMKGTDNYSSVDNEQYYKNANNEWKKVDEADEEFVAGLNTTEKDAYFKIKNKISVVNQEYKDKTNGLSKKDPLREKYSLEKKQNTIQAIVNSGLDNYTKAMVYSKYYSTQEKMTNVVNAGYDIDTYITASYDIEELRNKYSQKNGYSTAKRKKKTIAYINSLNMSIPQKAMLIRNYYSSFRSYNNDIVNYVANLDITYEEKVSILEDTGMKVKGNKVTWK